MARNRSDNRTAQPAEISPPMLTGALVVFVVLTVIHLGMCFDVFGFEAGHAESSAILRRSSLLFLFSPDRMLEMWCGNKLAYFSFFDRTPIALAAGAIVLGAWIAGQLVLDLLGITRLLDQLERAVFAIAVGLNLLSLYALAVGLAGGLQLRWLFIGPLVGLLAYRAVRFVLDLRQNRAESIAWPERAERRWLWWLVVVVPYAAVIVLGAMLPPYEYDVREYHLQVPKEWFQQGRIDFLPHNIYGNMPLGSELTALWGMALMGGKDAWWWGAIVGKTVMACYALVPVAGLVALGRRVHSTGAGVLAAIAYLSTPWITHVSLVGYNEGPTALYFLCSFHALWLAWRAEQPKEIYKLTALAGFLAGAAVACKYPPALFLVVPCTAWVAIIQPLLRQRHRTAASSPKEGEPLPSSSVWTQVRTAAWSVSIYLAVVLASCGLWLGKNWALTANPTYPLLYSAFDGDTRTPEKDRQWRRVHSPQPDEQGRAFTLQILVKDLAWNLWRTKGASIVLLPLVAAAWLAGRQRGFVAMISLWLLFVVASWWLLTHRLDRFLVPVLPLVALLAGIGAVAIPHPTWRRVTFGFLMLGALAQFPFAALLLGDHRYFAPLDAVHRDDPRIAEIVGLRIDSPHRWLNAHVPPGRRVLLVGDAEPFDLEMPAVYNTCFDDCQFARIFQGRTRAERLAILKQEGISHIFFSWAHLARYRSPGNYGYTSDYVTRDLVHRELVAEQRLLRKVNVEQALELGLPQDIHLQSELGEVFEVLDR